MDIIKYVQDQLIEKPKHPSFRPGDTVAVSYRIVEGDKQRIQIYKGDVIKMNGEQATKTFTVRKISSGVGVERIFPLTSPNVTEIKVLKRGKVRRAKLYYLRDLVGKKAKIKERAYTGK
jgi:large subunit ribosomal protein L19